MTRLCAPAGMARRTAGAATAPSPALTRARRDMSPDFSCLDVREFRSNVVILSSLDPVVASGVAHPRRLEMLQHLGAQRGLIIGAPLAKPFARLEAEPTLGDQRLQ